MIDDISPTAAWEAVRSRPNAWLVDVRTPMEWEHIGVPDLSGAGRTLVRDSWQLPPAGQVNPDFVTTLEKAGIGKTDEVYFICRSGARSMAAAHAAYDAGYHNVHNVADGFEGPEDATGRRGCVAGWQASELPWSRG
ncbi:MULTISPECIES: rhodanese-like domain-containing protein [Komagataeibacter]|uniref:Rhodanese-like domain-containing protein n=4 Tax=Komagataeibacter TaxID=1434011 RepID=A0A318QWK9_9PROT|nr:MULTISPECIES: rhodanese-like domain-containing protein [Komagataeibacter]GBR35633.1 sulfide dehydrogenase [Komagataeibacter oboediens DSM 11826]KPH85170.1 sulfurtransferase [Komagataeibacter intermedius AF2]MBL7234472.1 rhodanese-like domain-containing protein [Komagataeibacter oboediens]MBT0676326.1 rhodanese-like domain-containing protein [Komagataeibacter oboediens]MBT0679572.1 rhodanese-like domain-containing protein [Komagataeibacter oboediens]